MYLCRQRPQVGTSRKRLLRMEHEMLVRRALRELPTEIQHKISQILKEPPPAPRKPMSARLRAYINRWTDPSRPKIAPRAIIF